jgi:hypothetical protein
VKPGATSALKSGVLHIYRKSSVTAADSNSIFNILNACHQEPSQPPVRYAEHRPVHGERL